MSALIIPPFAGSRLKIERARRHIAELEGLLKDYGERLTTCYEAVEDDPENMRLVLSEMPPQEIAMIAGDAVHNLRAALDILMCDIARIRSKSTKKIYFPFAKSRESYETTLKNEVGRLGLDVKEALLACMPYDGGNLMLKGLHDLDIADKHDMIIPVIAVSWGKGFPEVFEQMRRKAYPGHQLPKITFIMDELYTKTLSAAGDLVPTSILSDSDLLPYKSGLPATALIADGLPFARKHVLPTLKDLAQLTFEIVESFATKFGDQSAVPHPSPGGNY